MCLGVPALVVEVLPGGLWAVIDSFGLRRKVGTHLVGEVVPGDYLMVHAGYAVEKLDLAEAEERIKIWEELLNSVGT
ncbi:MAG: HypC/HybG/HupF family hydrogenase formation chaperone [Eubacteriales bacterium]